MRQRAIHSLVIWAFLLSCFCSFANAEPIDDALGRIKAYRFGQSRADMNVVEQMVTASRANPSESGMLARKLAAVLETDATYDCKQFLCRQLVLIATEEQTPALAHLLGDEKLSHMALYVMVRIPGEAVNNALRSALGRTEGRTKVGIVNALGDRRDEKALDSLGRLSLSEDAALAGPAAWAMAKIGTGKAARALNTALSQAKGDLHTAVADAYLACADNLLESGDGQAAAKIYQQVYSSDEKALIRAVAMRGLAASKGPQATGLVVAGLSDREPLIRCMAARIAIESPEQIDAQSLAQQLPKLPAAGQAVLLGILADRGDKTVLPAIKNLCQSETESVRVEAVKAIGKLGDASSVKFLADRAANGGDAEREAARKSLSGLQGKQVDERIAGELPDAAAPVKVELIKALGDRGAGDAADILLETAADEDLNVSVTSLRVLRNLGDCGDLDALVDVLVASGSRQRSEAVKTVVAVARRCAGENRQTEPVLEKLRTVADAGVRSSLLEVLGKIGGNSALAVLRQSLTDEEPEVCAAAIRALAEWPNAEPIGDLLAVVKNTDDPQRRILALRGYIRLIGLGECGKAKESFEMYRRAMEFASSSIEKKLVLSGLANVNSAEALEYAAGRLDDPTLRQEAEVAVAEIARATCGGYRERTAEILKKVLQGTSNETIRTQGRAIIEIIEKFGDFVTAWEVSVAYEKEGFGCTQLFDAEFPPETSTGDEVCWTLMPAGTNPEQPWLMDLLAVLGGENRVAYLRNRVWSPEAQALILELGSDDGVKVWLNGKVVYASNVMRAVAPAQEKVKLTLEKGWNTLMLKITQNVMGWGACARFTRPDGSKAEQLRFAAP